MIQPPARLGEGESAGRRPGGSAAEAGKARFGGFAAGPAARSCLQRKPENPAKTKSTPSPCTREKLLC